MRPRQTILMEQERSCQRRKRMAVESKQHARTKTNVPLSVVIHYVSTVCKDAVAQTQVHRAKKGTSSSAPSRTASSYSSSSSDGPSFVSTRLDAPPAWAAASAAVRNWESTGERALGPPDCLPLWSTANSRTAPSWLSRRSSRFSKSSCWNCPQISTSRRTTLNCTRKNIVIATCTGSQSERYPCFEQKLLYAVFASSSGCAPCGGRAESNVLASKRFGLGLLGMPPRHAS